MKFLIEVPVQQASTLIKLLKEQFGAKGVRISKADMAALHELRQYQTALKRLRKVQAGCLDTRSALAVLHEL